MDLLTALLIVGVACMALLAVVTLLLTAYLPIYLFTRLWVVARFIADKESPYEDAELPHWAEFFVLITPPLVLEGLLVAALIQDQ